MALLEVTGLMKTYGRRQVVKGVSFQVDGGEVVGLLGPNGAGKTTSFRMTIGMIPPQAGKVVFAGQEVTRWPMYKRARLGVGYLSQESSIFRKLTVEQNLLAILEAMPPLRSVGRRLSSHERMTRTHDVLEQFGLTKVIKSLASTLSGGERRRLEIARCLVCEPLLILLDEPFTGIDPITISDIQGIVRDLRARGIGVLITDHNVREALKITDRSYVIADGVVDAHGTPDEIVRNELVINKYLGREFVADGFLPSAAYGPPPAAARVHQVLQQDKIDVLIETLTTDGRAQAERDLLQIGRPALPALLEAMERGHLETRRMAFHMFQRIADGAGHFDAYAQELQRRQQIELLRQQFLRKAG